MSKPHVHREIVEHLSRVMMRVRWLESQDADRGFNHGRAHEHAALTWVLEYLAADFELELTEAELLAEDRHNRNMRQRGARQ
jgi:hypothetical protein